MCHHFRCVAPLLPPPIFAWVSAPGILSHDRYAGVRPTAFEQSGGPSHMGEKAFVLIVCVQAQQVQRRAVHL